MKSTQYYTRFLTLVLVISLSYSCKSYSTTTTGAITASTPDTLTTLIFVRHAEKASDGTRDPDLNEAGQARANNLANMLSSSGVTAIYSTPYKRTRQTAAPLAEKTGIDIQEYAPRDPAALKVILKNNKGGTILIVGHSNTTPMLVNTALGQKKYEQFDEKEYSNLILVMIDKDGAKDIKITF